MTMTRRRRGKRRPAVPRNPRPTPRVKRHDWSKIPVDIRLVYKKNKGGETDGS